MEFTEQTLSNRPRRVHQMVNWFNLSTLIFLSTSCLSLLAINPKNIQVDLIIRYLEDANYLAQHREDEECKENWKKLKDIIKLDATLLSHAIDQLSLKDQTLVLRSLKEKHGDEFIQDLFEKIVDYHSHKTALFLLSEENFKKIGENLDPKTYAALPLIDFLNNTHLPAFFEPRFKNNLINKPYFNDFNSFDRLNLWIEPFGFSTQMKEENGLHLKTTGITLGGELTFIDRLVLGLGASYSYCETSWKDLHKASATIHTLYLGPTLNYLFNYGYLSLTLLGAFNFYDLQRKIVIPHQEPTQSDDSHNSLDLSGRLSGGFTIPLGGNFYLYPYTTLDYLHVFQQKAVENLDKETTLTIDPSHNSFLRSETSLEIAWEYFYEGFGYFIPSLSAGYLHYASLSAPKYSYQINAADGAFFSNPAHPSWNQPYFSFSFSLIHQSATFISFTYRLEQGENPVNAWNLRISISW